MPQEHLCLIEPGNEDLCGQVYLGTYNKEKIEIIFTIGEH